jgi:hypothetical protein
MTMKALVAVVVDILMILFVLTVYFSRVQLVFNTKAGAVITPPYLLYGVAIAAMVAATAWWMLGRRP